MLSSPYALRTPLPAALDDQQQEVTHDSQNRWYWAECFPAVEDVDVRDAGRNAEVILGTKIEGKLTTVTIKLSYGQAETLASLLEPFRKG